MNIYLIWQNENNNYDTFDSAVVIAENEYEARCTHPNPEYKFIDNELYFICEDGTIKKENYSYGWVDNPFKVEVELIGSASKGAKPRVVCTSFNAG